MSRPGGTLYDGRRPAASRGSSMAPSEPADSEPGTPDPPVRSAALLGAIFALFGAGGRGAAFERVGLGHVFRSWVGPGTSIPVMAAEPARALGRLFNELATLASAPGTELLAALARRLPQIVDRLTPDGTLPSGGVDLRTLAACLRT